MRCDLLSEVAILDVLADERAGLFLGQAHDVGSLVPEYPRLAAPIDERSNESLRERDVSVDPSLTVPDVAITPREDPGWRSLEHRHVFRQPLDVGDELDRGSAGADHG